MSEILKLGNKMKTINTNPVTNGDLKRLNYDKLAACNPCEFCKVTNRGETFSLVEHPFKGDEYPIIIIHHATRQAVCSDFFDTCDLEDGYKPILMNGKIEIELG